jgi:hypothetical protein
MNSVKKKLRELNPKYEFIDGCDEAIIGIDQNRVYYDRMKCVNTLSVKGKSYIKTIRELSMTELTMPTRTNAPVLVQTFDVNRYKQEEYHEWKHQGPKIL